MHEATVKILKTMHLKYTFLADKNRKNILLDGGQYQAQLSVGLYW